MPRHRFTLAALATSAVPGLDVATAQAFTGGGEGAYDTALVTASDGSHAIVRVPETPKAARDLAAESSALGALTTGARARLPFRVARVRGSAIVPGPSGVRLNALVSDYLPGHRVALSRVGPESAIADSIGAAIAAVHALPTSVVADAGMPVEAPLDCIGSVAALIDRAGATGSVPTPVQERWESALADTAIWRFQSTVVHGALSADVLLTDQADGDAVTGVLGWSALRVGDPARDLAWVLGMPVPGASDRVFAAYERAAKRGDRELRHRAALYAELELARWLLFGVDGGSTEIVHDAEDMLDGLYLAIENGTANPISANGAAVLHVDEVERMLVSTERVTTSHAQSLSAASAPAAPTRRQSATSSDSE